jgi:hypothetical protein
MASSYIFWCSSGNSKVGIKTQPVSISIFTISAILTVFDKASGKNQNFICISSSSKKE